ncbi:unnamed protein product [[Candida] boidinii]|nr:unnamed protein product [[Candida] boidinii]
MAPKKGKTSPSKAPALVQIEEQPTVELTYEKGELREYINTSLSDDVLKQRDSSNLIERLLVGSLAFFALYTRFKDLSFPNSVVFDEVHFGGFAKKYINKAFFMDVHPPLAKLLFAFVAVLGGFKGDFDFAKIGDVYPDSVPYVLMRQLPALLGVGTVVLCYLTLRVSGVHQFIAFFTSALLIVENANITVSRYILLDSPLIFFIAASAYSLKKLEIAKPFSFTWYKALIASGISLGLSISSKWVGLFTIAWAGAITLYNLLFVIADLKVSAKQLTAQVALKSSALLGLPLIVYLLSFYIHISVLTKEGDGAPFMSPAFRTSFEDSSIPKQTYADVGVSSVVTLRHVNTRGGYLHSHDFLYEGGSKQQQITLYPHLDNNNKWSIELYNVSGEPFEFVPITDDHQSVKLTGKMKLPVMVMTDLTVIQMMTSLLKLLRNIVFQVLPKKDSVPLILSLDYTML